MGKYYDITGARNAGLDEESIFQYLIPSRNYDYQGALSAGVSIADINDYLANMTPSQTSSYAPQPLPVSQPRNIDSNQATMSAAPPRNLLRRGWDYIREMGESRPVKPGGEPLSALGLASKAAFDISPQFVREEISPSIDNALGAAFPKTAGALQGIAEAASGFLTPGGIGMIKGLGALGNATVSGVRGAKTARTVAELGIGTSAAVGAVKMVDAGVDAWIDGNEQEAARLFTGAGVDAAMTALIIGGWRAKYKNAKARVDARNQMIEDVRAASARDVTPAQSSQTQSPGNALVRQQGQNSAPQAKPVQSPSAPAPVPTGGIIPQQVTSPATQQTGLNPYSEREINSFQKSNKIAVARSDEQIRDFIEKSIVGRVRGKKLLLGKIGDGLAQRIYNETNVDLRNYNLELRADEMRHAFKQHSDMKAELSRGQQSITADDIRNFPMIVYAFDNVLVGTDNSLHFIKDINGQTTAVTIYADGNKSLSLKTMYKRKVNGDSDPATNTQKSLGHNVQNDWATVPTSQTIPPPPPGSQAEVEEWEFVDGVLRRIR